MVSMFVLMIAVVAAAVWPVGRNPTDPLPGDLFLVFVLFPSVMALAFGFGRWAGIFNRPVGAAAALPVCQTCGRVGSPKFRFCPFCGTPLSSGPPD